MNHVESLYKKGVPPGTLILLLALLGMVGALVGNLTVTSSRRIKESEIVVYSQRVADSSRLHLLAITSALNFRNYLISGNRSYLTATLETANQTMEVLSSLQIDEKNTEGQKKLRRLKDLILKLIEMRDYLIHQKQQKVPFNVIEDYFNKKYLRFSERTLEAIQAVILFGQDRVVKEKSRIDAGITALARRVFFIIGTILLATLIASLIVWKRITASSSLMREKELLFTVVNNAAIDALITADEQNKIVTFNPAAEQMFKFSRDEALGKNFAKTLLNADSAKKYTSKYLDQAAFKQPHKFEESREVYIGLKADHSEFPIELTAGASRTDGKLVFAMFIRDITVEKKRADALARSEEKFRKTVELAVDVFWEADFKLNRLSWKMSTNSQLNVVNEEPGITIEKAIEQYIHPEDRKRLADELNAALSSHSRLWNGEYRIVRRDGDYASVLYKGFIDYDPNFVPTRATGVCTDVSSLRRAIQSRDELVGVISHELRNPLAALMTGLELVERIISQNRLSEAIRLVHKLRPSLHRMNRLINDLLDITRIEAKTLALKLSENRIEEVIKEIRSIYEPVAREKGVQLLTRVPQELPLLQFDFDRIFQVLSNFVSNAVKFTAAGGTINIYCEVSCNVLKVAVSDTGAGISEENLTKVFGRFWQLKEVAFKGTGLGLAISKGIIESHGGKIWVESAVNKGSIFFFSLPVREVKKESAA